MSFREPRKTIKSFAPELAGQPVGYTWLSSSSSRDYDSPILGSTDVVVADIAEGGAAFELQPSEDGYVYSSDDTKGFEKQHGIHVERRTDGAVKGTLLPRSIEPRSSTKDHYMHTILMETTFLDAPEITGREMGWIDNDLALSLRSMYRLRAMSVLYKPVYYGLAAASKGRPRVIDQELHETTQDELDLIQGAIQSLTTAIRSNSEFVQFTDLAKAAELKVMADSEFVRLRRAARQAEVEFTSASESSSLQGLEIYTYVGEGPNARVVLDLNTSSPNEENSFGSVKRSLRNGRSGMAVDALRQESLELVGRVRLLEEARESLMALFDAEANALNK